MRSVMDRSTYEALLDSIRKITGTSYSRMPDQWGKLFKLVKSAPTPAPSSMRTYAADDASISENLRRICSTEQRPPPLVAGVCALTIGKMQSECKLCAPDLPCFGCVKKRNPTAGVADCIICAGTSKPCPSR
jgi:hypothetical protein